MDNEFKIKNITWDKIIIEHSDYLPDGITFQDLCDALDKMPIPATKENLREAFGDLTDKTREELLSTLAKEKSLKINFGTYPQGQVTDSTLINALNNAAGKLPKSGHDELWSDYGYYVNGKVESHMWYIDLIVDGNKYRGVYFTNYRPSWILYSLPNSLSFQYDNGYKVSNIYWFKYEPITWRVLDVQSDRAFLMANLVLDSQDFHYSTSVRTIDGSTIYSNNYKESHIRSWLNDVFYDTAFNTEEKSMIQTTNVDNSAASTGYDSNRYACADTKDKVFLLSYVEVTSAAYGLDANVSKQLATSPYAKSQGVYTYTNGFCLWWLRSPESNVGFIASYVNLDGFIDEVDLFTDSVSLTSYGIVPALWISLSGSTNLCSASK